jgi:y4mF family transcriptional regulator
MQTIFSKFFKEQRKKMKLTQKQLALKAGVGLRFIRDVEQGKKTIRLDKVNNVLELFDHEAGPVRLLVKVYRPNSPSLTSND